MLRYIGYIRVRSCLGDGISVSFVSGRFVLRYIGCIRVRSCLCDGISVTFVLGRVCVTVYRLH